MSQGNGALQMLCIERSALAAVNTAIIHQSSCITGSVTAQPLVGRAQADARLGGEMGQGLSILSASTHKPFPTDRCQSGVGVGMHGV
jgi:hypothetical protein